MYWSYMSFPDDTEVTFSETHDDGTVGVWIETPIEGGFKSAHCIIPAFRWDTIDGYTADEKSRLDRYVRNNAHIIIRKSLEREEAASRARA